MWLVEVALIRAARQMYEISIPLAYYTVAPGFILGLLIAASILLSGWLSVVLLISAYGRLLDTKRPAQSVRYIGLAILIIGFHLDLLAS